MRHIVDPLLWCFVPVRAGGSEVPNKNTRMLHGYPVLAYTLKAIYELPFRKIVCVSTDCPRCEVTAQEMAKRHVDEQNTWFYLHPRQDITKREGPEAFRGCIEAEMPADLATHFIFCQATSPLRDRGVLADAVTQMVKHDHRLVISVEPRMPYMYHLGFGGWRPNVASQMNRPRQVHRPSDLFYEDCGSFRLGVTPGSPAALTETFYEGDPVAGGLACHPLDRLQALQIDSMADWKMIESGCADRLQTMMADEKPWPAELTWPDQVALTTGPQRQRDDLDLMAT